MTPKEKAQELWWKFFHAQATEENGNLDGEIAYQCALIAVDEMLTWFKAHSYSNKNYDAFVFYNEVKQEIEAL
jgi:hypothetical protein